MDVNEISTTQAAVIIGIASAATAVAIGIGVRAIVKRKKTLPVLLGTPTIVIK